MTRKETCRNEDDADQSARRGVMRDYEQSSEAERNVRQGEHPADVARPAAHVEFACSPSHHTHPISQKMNVPPDQNVAAVATPGQSSGLVVTAT